MLQLETFAPSLTQQDKDELLQHFDSIPDGIASYDHFYPLAKDMILRMYRNMDTSPVSHLLHQSISLIFSACVCMCGVYVWCVCVVCMCGVYVWCVCVVCVCGVCVWCVCGVYVWCACVVCMCGVCVWCVCGVWCVCVVCVWYVCVYVCCESSRSGARSTALSMEWSCSTSPQGRHASQKSQHHSRLFHRERGKFPASIKFPSPSLHPQTSCASSLIL